MHPDEDPTQQILTTSIEAAPPAPARVGRRTKVAVTSVAAVLLVAAGTGIGMATTGDSSPPQPAAESMGMGMDGAGTPAAGGKDAPKGKPGEAGDAQRQQWAQQYGHDRAAMPNLPDVASATPDQRAAAADLLTRTEAATAKYADVNVAKAAGFDLDAALARAESRSPKVAALKQRIDSGQMPKRMPMLHVANAANRKDGRTLDPTAPETLMYEYTARDTWRLIGVMYTANEAFPNSPPDPGGPITRWHYHAAHGAGLMMHVFFVPGNDLAKAYALTMVDA